MRLTVEVLDQKTLCWKILACHDDVGIDAAPAIVGLLRDGLPPVASIRWNWSRRDPLSPGALPVASPAVSPGRRMPRKKFRRR